MHTTPIHAAAERIPVGALMREWRTRRRRSQMDVALAVGVSPRHLSFVETGRSRPSPATLLAMAEELQVPLRERNRLLLAAGYAPRFQERAIAGPEMSVVLQSLQRLLDAHQPYPGVVLDRHWNVVLGNAATQAMIGLLPPELITPVPNIFRLSLHPQGMASITANFDEWGRYLLRQLRRLAADAPDAQWEALSSEVLAYPNVAALASREVPAEEATLLVPCVMQLPAGRVSMFTTLTTFGTPRDITLEELCVELFYPADEASAALLRAMAGAG
ncbi:MAG: helix-turn-helix domain-containing protein [Burkholderiaceae bacterium]